MVNIKHLYFKNKIFFRRRRYILYILSFIIWLTTAYQYNRVTSAAEAAANASAVVSNNTTTQIIKQKVLNKNEILSEKQLKDIFQQLKNLDCINIISQSSYGTNVETKGYNYVDAEGISTMNIEINYLGRYKDCMRILSLFSFKSVLIEEFTINTICPQVSLLKAKISVVHDGKSSNTFEPLSYTSQDPTMLFPKIVKEEKLDISFIVQDQDKRKSVLIKRKSYEQGDMISQDKYIAHIDTHFIILEVRRKDQKPEKEDPKKLYEKYSIAFINEYAYKQ